MAQDTLQRLIRAKGQSRSARTVEVFGWIMLAEAAFVMWTLAAWRAERVDRRAA